MKFNMNSLKEKYNKAINDDLTHRSNYFLTSFIDAMEGIEIVIKKKIIKQAESGLDRASVQLMTGKLRWSGGVDQIIIFDGEEKSIRSTIEDRITTALDDSGVTPQNGFKVSCFDFSYTNPELKAQDYHILLRFEVEGWAK